MSEILIHGLRSEKLFWSFFRTGVRLPPPPPDYLPSIDKKNFLSVGGFSIALKSDNKPVPAFCRSGFYQVWSAIMVGTIMIELKGGLAYVCFGDWLLRSLL